MKFVVLSLFIVIVSTFFSQKTTKVLFIGNSFTFMNGMPSMVKRIAEAKKHAIYVDSCVQGGKDWDFHANRQLTYDKIKDQDWDFIFLQAHSNELAQPDSKVDKHTLPFGKLIVDSIRKLKPCAKVLLYMTWGYKNGNDKWKAIANYDSMQYRISNQYLRISDILVTSVSPVGEVWKKMRKQYAAINLYDPDLFHPSIEGSYVAACTHFTSIFGESPFLNTATIPIKKEIRNVIELVATETVLNNLHQWRNIPPLPAPYLGFDVIISKDEVFCSTNDNTNKLIWDFGDGFSSSELNPSHCYSQKGTYLISLKEEGFCNERIIQKAITIQ